ncbi:hypothetical protein lerEdw1_012583 [Lerista edwardsae]|nr:hypothetical protein lerEdw1_012583 [Lerista edwardsae]
MRMAAEPPSLAEEPAANGCEQCKDFHPAPEIEGEISTSLTPSLLATCFLFAARPPHFAAGKSLLSATPLQPITSPFVWQLGGDNNRGFSTDYEAYIETHKASYLHNTIAVSWISIGAALTVRNQERARAHELRSENIPYCEESSTPTLEEVNAWGQSFDTLMRTPAGRNAFREFLRTEFSEENMLFWMACEDLKRETNKNLIQEKARRIYEDYVSILSPKEVSLDSRVRDLINRNMLEPSKHSFDDAQLQIYTLMHRDSYPRFMNSEMYRDLVESFSQKSAEA